MRKIIEKLEDFYLEFLLPYPWLHRTEKGTYMPSKPEVLFEASRDPKLREFFGRLNREHMLIDLGSGDGLAISFFGLFDTNISGIEYDKMLFDFSNRYIEKAVNRFSLKANIHIIREDFLKYDFSRADLFYYYEETDEAFKRVYQKFEKEAKGGALMLVLHDSTHISPSQKKAECAIPPEFYFSLYERK